MPLSPDLDEAFADAAHVVECDVEQNRYVAMPMETRGIVASCPPGREELEIVCATQSVHETRNFFARYLQIPEGNVHVTARDVGGGFGQKMFVYREECAVVLASCLLGRPVKWIEDRRENLLSAGHSRNEFAHVRMAVDADGIIQAITADARGRRRRVRGRARRRWTRCCCPGRTRPRGSASRSRWCWTNTMGKAAYRGPWMFETTAREMAIDYVAARDRHRSRRVPAPQPARAAPTCRSPRRRGNVFQEITPLETLEQALEILDYEAFRKEQAAALARGPVPRRRASAPTWSRRRWAATRSHTEAATVQVETERPASSRTSAPRRTVRASRPPWRRSSPSTSASTTTTSPSCRPTRSRRRTAPAPAAAAPRSSPAAPRARPRSRCARRCSPIAAHMMEASPDDLEIAEGVVSVRGTPSKSVTHAGRRQAWRTQRRTSSPPSSAAGSRRRCGSGPRSSPRGRTPRTSAWSRSTPRPGCPR